MHELNNKTKLINKLQFYKIFKNIFKKLNLFNTFNRSKK